MREGHKWKMNVSHSLRTSARTRTIYLMEHVGCEVERVQRHRVGGAPDDEVFQVAQDRRMVLVTTDKGFGDVRVYPPSSHHGILVLKVTPDPEQIQSVHRTLSTLLESEEQFEEPFLLSTRRNTGSGGLRRRI
jgi:predicted nuclease of predicted toxin-antitoxin system